MFPFDTPSWDGVSGAIFQGANGGSLPGVCSFIGIVICIVALAVGQRAEAAKYAKHK